jgi:hypothetical protein
LFEAYLQANDVTFTYQLETPVANVTTQTGHILTGDDYNYTLSSDSGVIGTYELGLTSLLVPTDEQYLQWREHYNTFIIAPATLTYGELFADGLEAVNVAEIAKYTTVSVTDLYNIFVDPYEADYSVYYNSTGLSQIGISYTAETGDYTEPDADNAIDKLLTNINMNTENGKIGLGIALLFVITVAIGFITKNTVITLIATVLTFTTLTVLGWFPAWIIIIVLIILTIFIYLKSEAIRG